MKKMWLEAIKKSYIALLLSHPRSNDKLKPIHQWIRIWLEEHLDRSYEVFSLHTDKKFSKEKKVIGAFYEKTTDIAIVRDKKVKGVIFFKNISSNYSQNSNNYFESMLGETTNLRLVSIPIAQFLVFREDTPYFDKDRRVTKYEQVSDRNLEKYIKLLKKRDIVASPDELSITIVRIAGDRVNGDVVHSYEFKKLNEKKKKNIINSLDVSYSNLNHLNDETKKALEDLTIEKSLQRFIKHCLR